MAINHWNSLAEAEKLTQSFLIPGVIEENIYRNPILGMNMPVAWTPGKTILYNRELSESKDDVAVVDIGSQLSWSSSVTYQQKEVTLKRRYIQRILDTFIKDVYGTINDYEAVIMAECQKAMFVDLNEQIIYGDLTYNSGEFDGMHAWAAEESLVSSGSGLNYDGEDKGLNLKKLRNLDTTMKLGVDVYLFPFQVADRLAAAYIDGLGGEVTGVFTSRGQLSYVSMGVNELGKRVMFWNGVPIVPTDYLVAEESGTGTGSSSNARALYSTDSTFSIFAIRFGNVYQGNPGFMYGFGSTEMSGQLYKTVLFDELEDFDASGIRLVSYGATILGSKYGLGRMFDVDDDDVIVST
ncbi:hypothetical protein LCGC14_2773640 [marine sediment metagenome]|uniref:Major capsid protein n=1 Tax=marine sediment metagenome TaxID=412755 RepID=A0A0F8ZHB9_9ZZZZ